MRKVVGMVGMVESTSPERKPLVLERTAVSTPMAASAHRAENKRDVRV